MVDGWWLVACARYQMLDVGSRIGIAFISFGFGREPRREAPKGRHVIARAAGLGMGP